MPEPTDPLSEDGLDLLHAAYDRKEMTDAISKSLPAMYPASGKFLDAILETFYKDLPPDTQARDRKELSLLDRERCLIAILASQNDQGALAVHMYFALMEGLSSAEIAHILLLSGTYTGVSHFSRGLFVEKFLLGKLRKMAGVRDAQLDPGAVVPELLKFFEPLLASGT